MSVVMSRYRRYGAGRENKPHGAEEKVLALARKVGVLRPRDLRAHGIPRVVLTRLHRKERLKRVGRGMYVLPEADLSEHHSLAEACKRVPHGVVCLLSALRFHGLTTQSPFEVWMAIDVKARKPNLETPPLRIVRFSGKALVYGVEEHQVEGVTVRVTSPAKTVADCFKYRNKIGLDVAVEGLRDYRRARKSLDEVWKAAEACRVASVIRPYLEALG
jgi:predicted transcriptional regulator of viral defense system